VESFKKVQKSLRNILVDLRKHVLQCHISSDFIDYCRVLRQKEQF